MTNSYSIRISNGKCEIQNPLKLGNEVTLTITGDVVQLVMNDTQSDEHDTTFIVKAREVNYVRHNS
jgi:hypothetical protein